MGHWRHGGAFDRGPSRRSTRPLVGVTSKAPHRHASERDARRDRCAVRRRAVLRQGGRRAGRLVSRRDLRDRPRRQRRALGRPGARAAVVLADPRRGSAAGAGHQDTHRCRRRHQRRRLMRRRSVGAWQCSASLPRIHRSGPRRVRRHSRRCVQTRTGAGAYRAVGWSAVSHRARALAVGGARQAQRRRGDRESSSARRDRSLSPSAVRRSSRRPSRTPARHQRTASPSPTSAASWLARRRRPSG